MKVEQVVISLKQMLVDPTHVVPLEAPVRLLETYSCHYVGYYLADSTTTSEEAQTQQQPNALEILMQNAGRLALLPVAVNASLLSGSEQQLRGDQTSYRLRLLSAFTIFTGYDWKKKIKTPRLSCEELQQHKGKVSLRLLGILFSPI